MTTLDLAHAIANAVLAVRDEPRLEPWRDPATQAVMRVLDESGSWFCRLSENERGTTVEEPFKE